MIKQFQYLVTLWKKVLLFNCSKLSAVTKLLPSVSSKTTSTSILTIFISQRRINQVSKASVYRESVNQLLTRPGLDPDLIKKRIDWRHCNGSGTIKTPGVCEGSVKYFFPAWHILDCKNGPTDFFSVGLHLNSFCLEKATKCYILGKTFTIWFSTSKKKELMPNISGNT